jgi:hypothetical protein
MREKSHVEILASQVVLYFMSDKNSEKSAYAVISSIKYQISFERYELYIVCRCEHGSELCFHKRWEIS